MRYVMCKICGDAVIDILAHLVKKHKKELMSELKEATCICGKCGKVFKEKPEPVITIDGKVKFFVPAWCKECAGAAYKFIVKEAEKYQLKLKRRRKRESKSSKSL